MTNKSAKRTVSVVELTQARPASEQRSGLNGLLLLVPILAVLALLGISLGVAAVFSTGFWPALGWTTLAIIGGLLLLLAGAIISGK